MNLSKYDGRPDTYHGRDEQTHQYSYIDWSKKGAFAFSNQETKKERNMEYRMEIERLKEEILQSPNRNPEKDEQIIKYIDSLDKFSSVEYEEVEDRLETHMNKFYLSWLELGTIQDILNDVTYDENSYKEMLIQEILEYPAICIAGFRDDIIVRGVSQTKMEWNEEALHSCNTDELYTVKERVKAFFRQYGTEYKLEMNEKTSR